MRLRLRGFISLDPLQHWRDDGFYHQSCRNMKTETDTCVSENNIADNGGRRKSGDRRNFCYTIHIPERRCGDDRRAHKDRRKQDRLLNDEC